MRPEQIVLPLLRAVAARPRLAAALLGRDKWGNPFDPAAVADPYVLVPTLVADGPVAYSRLYRQWLVTGYDEARDLLTHPDVIAGGQIATLLEVRPYSRLSERGRFLFRTLLPITDPPIHGRLRSLVGRAFTPRRIAELEPAVARVADRLLDDLAPDGPATPPVDVRRGFTVRLPIEVIAELLGVPEDRWPWVQRATTELVKLLDPLTTFDPDVVSTTVDELYTIYGAMADQRRVEPTGDLLSVLAAAAEDGDRLSTDELVVMVATLMGAGYETTSGILGTAIVALARQPEQRDLIRRRPELWPNAVEELLRFDTPVKVIGRQATADIDLAGRTITAGSNILVHLMSAHRDPRQYEDPYRLRLDRPDPRPLSFGHGPHHCLGASLARMEIRVGLQAFLDRFGDYTVDEDGVDWRVSLALRNQSRLTVSPGGSP